MMNRYKNAILALTVLSGVMFASSVFAGNPDRAGSAGGLQLLINPWARSGAFAGANMADATPVESMFTNVAGLAFVKSTEVAFTHTNYLSGADVGINSVGIAQRVGETGVLGISITAMDFGDIRRTTTATPDGDGTFFNVNMVNLGFSYAKAFSNSIYGGITLKILSESVADLSASGVALDAGIKYVTGERDQIKFGITLKNVGPALAFEGDGLSFETEAPDDLYAFTAELRSAEYELPSLVSIGFSYDFLLPENHFLTAHGTFIANSFNNDNYLFGLEYSFLHKFYLRGGYHYEENIWDDAERRYVYTGLSAGAGVEFEFGDNGSRISVDYAYRATMPFDGSHSIGARIHLGRSE
ncbi:MAG TPA: PorV/PorQ family protein [Cryomorphaceae bacterium]|nr:PorV/PorQ family protein [Cryomorphaceae bacterium]